MVEFSAGEFQQSLSVGILLSVVKFPVWQFFFPCYHSRFAPKLALHSEPFLYILFRGLELLLRGASGRKGMKSDILSLELNPASTACTLCKQEQVTWLLFAEHPLCAWRLRPSLGQAPVLFHMDRERDVLPIRGSQAVELRLGGSCVWLGIQGFRWLSSGWEVLQGRRVKPGGCRAGGAVAPSFLWEKFAVVCLITNTLLGKGLKLKNHRKIIIFLLHYDFLSYLSPWRIFAVNSG